MGASTGWTGDEASRSPAGAGEPLPAAAGGAILLRRKALAPFRRPATTLVLCAALLGLFGAYRYVWGFWLYRGFAAPQLPHEVPVALATPKAPVALPTARAKAADPAAARRAAFAAAASAVASLVQPEKLVHVDPGTLETIDVQSPVPGLKLPTIVYLPPGYFEHPTWRYPVLYLLHGSPGRPQQFVDVADVQVAEALLVARQQMHPMIIAMPGGGTDFFSDTEWVNEAKPHADWLSYFADGVVPAVQAHFRVIDSASGRAIGGNSEGGYGALNIALHYPGEFGLVESWSGYADADGDPNVFGTGSASAALIEANSPSIEVRRERNELLRDHTYFWFYCGRNDGDFVDNRQFAAELTSLGLPYRFFAPPGDHNWGVWRVYVPASLEVAAEHLSAPLP